MKSLFLFAILITLASHINSAQAESTESMNEISIHYCASENICTRVVAKGAVKSFLSEHYVVDAPQIFSYNKNSTKPPRLILSGHSGQISQSWDNWLIETDRGLVLFDPKTGQIN